MSQNSVKISQELRPDERLYEFIEELDDISRRNLNDIWLIEPNKLVSFIGAGCTAPF